MGAHSFYAPSSMDRVYRCPVSVLFNTETGGTSEYAEEGTQAHKLAEDMLKNPPDILDGYTKGVYKFHEKLKMHHTTVPYDMIEPVYNYAKFVNSMADDCILRKIEFRAPLTNCMGVSEEQSGTIDCLLYGKKNNVIIIDLKYGKGLRVNAADSLQLKTYGLGAMRYIEQFYGLPVESVECIIYQPRIANGVSRTIYTQSELTDYESSLKNKIWEAEQYRSGGMQCISSSFKPGEKQCQWCQKRRTLEGCPGLRKFVYDSVRLEFDNVN